MINLSFPDGASKQFASGTTGFEVASSLSQSLAKDAIVIEINGELRDLSLPLTEDARIRILTHKDPECLEVIRHDAAHILAEAAKELFPACKVRFSHQLELRQ